MKLDAPLVDRVKRSVQRRRLVDTVVRLVEVPSPTGDAAAVSDRLADILREEGFEVERPAGGHPSAPAVAVRYHSGRKGKVVQWNGHLDTVHLPFVPPKVDGDRITGSGSSDMKSGVAACVEALRVVRELNLLDAGGILLTAHDLHEAPWGSGQQLNQLIRDGYVGDAVLLPEPKCDCLPVVGRGAATWKVSIRRHGPPVHEVMRPLDEPNVIAAGGELISRLAHFNQRLESRADPLAGAESVFIGQVHSGEIYNQYPQECWLEGTRRWLPGVGREEVEREFRSLLGALEKESGTAMTLDFRFVRDAFRLDPQAPMVGIFQQCYQAVSGRPLAMGPKPFVDDGNSFWGIADVPAITHGPLAGGQHTLDEWVSIDDLLRLVQVYVLSAACFCNGD